MDLFLGGGDRREVLAERPSEGIDLASAAVGSKLGKQLRTRVVAAASRAVASPRGSR
jgi:hypothetical protein